jgi:hypothetical protein
MLSLSIIIRLKGYFIPIYKTKKYYFFIKFSDATKLLELKTGLLRYYTVVGSGIVGLHAFCLQKYPESKILVLERRNVTSWSEH